MEQAMTIGDSYRIIESDGGENLNGQIVRGVSTELIPDIPRPDNSDNWQLIT
jgi:hypothetical protein